MNTFFKTIFLAFSMTTMSNLAFAASDAVVQRTFVQTEHNDEIYPTTISRTADGNFLIAGGTDGHMGAWVSKVNAQGQTLWTYKSVPDGKFNAYFSLTEFLGIAAMPDGSAFLCGTSPRLNELNEHLSTALLTHVDVQGHVISEQFISPNNPEKNLNLSSKFVNCTPWGNGFVVMGDVWQAVGTLIPPQHGKREIKHYYWIIKYDAAGNAQWEKFIPYDFGNYSFFQQDAVLIEAGNKLVLSAATSDMTDVIEFSSAGDVIAKTKISPGLFRLVHPFAGSHDIQLINAPTLVTLDQNLREKNRVKGNNSVDFSSAMAFEMPDRSIVLSGMVPRFRSVMIHVDKNMQIIQNIDMKETGPRDFENIKSILPVDNNYNSFMVAKQVIKNNASIFQSKVSPGDFVRGMFIEIVKLK